MDTPQKVSKLINDAKNIVVITGAGISTASGIPDYRGKHGVYVTDPGLVDILSIETLRSDPVRFYDYFEKMLSGINQAKPNAAHLLIAEWASKRGKNITVVTQNIDSLHTRAGSNDVLELHGHARTFKYLNPYKQGMFPANEVVDEIGKIAYKQEGEIIRPCVVLFGEMLNEDDFLEAEYKLSKADLILVLGTSLTVYPFSGLVNYSDENIPLVVINKESPPVLRGNVTFLEGDILEIMISLNDKLKE
ncbi:MAG: NAD-dependent protein deacetylase [Clostridia bacterium]|nr:NAD-dependent protein deacetylase [Clostridia bacterium]